MTEIIIERAAELECCVRGASQPQSDVVFLGYHLGLRNMEGFDNG